MYFYRCKACEAIWYMDGDEKFRKRLPNYCPMCGEKINYDTPKNYIFISKPNKCDGCPLEAVPVDYKIIHACDLYGESPNRYKVNYTLSDNNLGHTVCKVRLK